MKKLYSLLNRKEKISLFFLIFLLLSQTISQQLELFGIALLTEQFTSSTQKEGVLGDLLKRVNEFLAPGESILPLAIFLLTVSFVRAYVLYLQRNQAKRFSIDVSSRLRFLFFSKMSRYGLNFFSKYTTGSLSSRMIGEITLVADAIESAIQCFISTPFTVLSTLTLCFLTSVKLTLFVFLGLPLIALPVIWISKRLRRISKELQSEGDRLSSLLLEFIQGIVAVKAFSMERYSQEKFDELNKKMIYLEKKRARYDSSSRPVVHTIGMLFLGATLLSGIYIFKLPLSSVLLFSGLLYLFYEPIKKLSEELTRFQKGIVAINRLLEVIDYEEEKVIPSGSTPFEFKKELQFQNLFFSYGSDPTLSDINFTIKKGEKIAIVGATGAGKSTLLMLLLRLFKPTSGDILIDGVSFSQFSEGSLRKKMAFVPQKPFLFIDTVEGNIRVGREANKGEVKTAAVKAHAAEFIDSFPHLYQEKIEESGKNLSGGQQQRLTIARALLDRGVEILLFDEATSHLDSVSEKLIQEALKDLKGDVTQIVVAHRFSTILDADKILYLESGRVTGFADPKSLYDTHIAFRLMYDMQKIV